MKLANEIEQAREELTNKTIEIRNIEIENESISENSLIDKNCEIDSENKLVITNKILNKTRLAICIILLVCLVLLLVFLNLKIKEKSRILNFKESIETSRTELIEKNIKEAAKKARELREKIASRNTNDFTVEQVQSIKEIYKSDGHKTAYLTFDDGPSANITPLILDVLKQENIKATFFVLGTNVKWYPNIVKRINTEGHYIANHGYSHKYNEIYQTVDSVMQEYIKCEQAIQNALGNTNYKSRIFRFPGGSVGGKYHDLKVEAKQLLENNNIAVLDWNALTNDSVGVCTKESIIENLKLTVEGKNTVVILMHDSASKILTYETLVEVINYLRNQGYQFGDMYDLIEE